MKETARYIMFGMALLLPTGCAGRQHAARAQILNAAQDGVHANAWYDKSEPLAQTLTADGLVRGAQVITTDRNIYVALQQSDPPATIRGEIERRVRTLGGTRVRRVFISTDGQFFQQLESMANGSPSGYPMNLEQFNAMVAHTFRFDPGSRMSGTDQTILPGDS